MTTEQHFIRSEADTALVEAGLVQKNMKYAGDVYTARRARIGRDLESVGNVLSLRQDDLSALKDHQTTTRSSLARDLGITTTHERFAKATIVAHAIREPVDVLFLDGLNDSEEARALSAGKSQHEIVLNVPDLVADLKERNKERAMARAQELQINFQLYGKRNMHFYVVKDNPAIRLDLEGGFDPDTNVVLPGPNAAEQVFGSTLTYADYQTIVDTMLVMDHPVHAVGATYASTLSAYYYQESRRYPSSQLDSAWQHSLPHKRSLEKIFGGTAPGEIDLSDIPLLALHVVAKAQHYEVDHTNIPQPFTQ